MTIHEGTRLVGMDPPAGLANRAGARPVELRTDAGGVPGRIRAEQVVLGLNAWAAGWPWSERRLVTWSSYIVLTEPIPDRLAELGWTGGEGVCDARFTLHYLRTTPDGRIALGRRRRTGRLGRPDRTPRSPPTRARRGGRRSACARLFPSLADVRIEDAWGGPIDICDDHRPFFGTLPGGRLHLGHGYSGNGVGPAHLGGRILAALALGRRDRTRCSSCRSSVVARVASRRSRSGPSGPGSSARRSSGASRPRRRAGR